MQPGRQWEERIKIWIDAIKSECYKPIGTSKATVVYTYEQFSKEEVETCEFKPIASGEKWGAKWQYAWFKSSIEIPESASGKRVVCIPDVGAEAICFVNGIAGGAFDKEHKDILLSRAARTGERYELLLEAYAGHGPRLENGGPYPMEVIPVPEAPDKQCTFNKIEFGIWQEEAYQLYIDAYVLWDLYQILDPKSLRAMKVLDALKQMTYIADVELEYEERIESFVKAREVLQDALNCKNGDSTPTMYICGQSHLDLAWLWTIDETKRKSGRTYSNQLKLMEEYPEYKYFACDPFVLKYLKRYYPETYKTFLEKVKNGQMVLEGGTYVEPDLNIPCGEALIRHFIYGKEAFKEIAAEAGLDDNDKNSDSEILWEPDVFGFPGSIPQIMKMCGLKYFSTQKLMRADPETEPFPYNNFIWKGIDGSEILSHLHMKNNTRICPHDLYDRWYTHRHQETGIDAMLYPFGFGDGGGGPVRDMLEISKRVENLEGIPKTKMSSPKEFFEHIENDGYRKPVYEGELYLAWHRGTFTGQSELKRGNRMAETTLRECERLIAEAYISKCITLDEARKYNEDLKEKWDILMYLQFHDVLPGSSIQKVNEDAREKFGDIIRSCYALKKSLHEKYDYVIENNKNDDANISCEEISNGIKVKNKYYTAIISNNGTLESIVMNDTGREFLNAPSNIFHLYKNVNCMYDAWEIGSMVYDEEVEISKKAVDTLKVLEVSNEKVVLEYSKTFSKSMLSQKIILEDDTPVIKFETNINWQERHKLLKVGFYPEVHTKEGIEEIQYGYIKRSFGENHQFEKDQYEVINHGYSVLCDDNHGAAVLNDGKYGVKVGDKEIALSLLRAPVIPDMTADLGEHSFTYAFMVFNGQLSDSNIVNETRALQKESLSKIEKAIDVNMTQMSDSDIITIESKSAVIDWIYLSGKHDNLVVLRINEPMNLSEDVKINCKFDYKKIAILDVYENQERELSKGESIHMDAFKVVTVGIYL